MALTPEEKQRLDAEVQGLALPDYAGPATGEFRALQKAKIPLTPEQETQRRTYGETAFHGGPRVQLPTAGAPFEERQAEIEKPLPLSTSIVAAPGKTPKGRAAITDYVRNMNAGNIRPLPTGREMMAPEGTNLPQAAGHELGQIARSVPSLLQMAGQGAKTLAYDAPLAVAGEFGLGKKQNLADWERKQAATLEGAYGAGASSIEALKDPLRAPIAASTTLGGLIAAPGSVLSTAGRAARLAGRFGTGKALTGAWAAGLPAAEVADALATPRFAGELGRMVSGAGRGGPLRSRVVAAGGAAESLGEGFKTLGGEAAGVGFNLPLSFGVPTAASAYGPKIVKAIAGVPGKTVIGDAAAAVAGKVLPGARKAILTSEGRLPSFLRGALKPDEYGAALRKYAPVAERTLGAREAFGKEVMGTVGQSLKNIGNQGRLPSPLTGEPVPALQATGEVMEALPEQTQAEWVRQAKLPDQPGREGIRQGVLRESFPDLAPPSTRETLPQGGWKPVFDDPLTGKTYTDLRAIPPDVAERLITRHIPVEPPQPSAPIPLKSKPGENLPTPAREGIDFSKHGPTTLPGPIPSGAAVGRAAESGVARAKTGESFLPLPEAPPPPRQPIPVMPPPGFSTAGKAQMQAMGEAPGIAPPTLKAPPPLPRLEEASAFKSPPLRAVNLPGAPPVVKPGEFPSLAQPLAGQTIPEVTPAGTAGGRGALAGTPEVPSLKPGAEVKTQVKGVTPGAEPVPPKLAEWDLPTSQAAIVDLERAQNQAALKPAMAEADKAQTVLDNLGAEHRRRGLSAEVDSDLRRGSYRVSKFDEETIRKENPDLYRKLKDEEAVARKANPNENPDSTKRRIWADATAKYQKEKFGQAYGPVESMIATARHLADDIGRARATETLAEAKTADGAAMSLAPADFEALRSTKPKAVEGWRKVHGETDRQKRLNGPLEGKYVAPEIHATLRYMDNWVDFANPPKTREWMQVWKTLKLTPPLSIATSVRNNVSFAASQAMMGNIGLTSKRGRTAMFKVLGEYHGKQPGPAIADFMADGGGSSAIYAPGAPLPTPVFQSLTELSGAMNPVNALNPRKWFTAIAEGELGAESIIGSPTWKEFAKRTAARVVGKAVQVVSEPRAFLESENVKRGSALYAIQDQIQKNSIHYMVKQAQAEFRTGGKAALDMLRDYEKRFGRKMARRILEGSGKEAMEVAELVGMNYANLSPWSQGIARNIAPFASFRFAASELVDHWIRLNPNQVNVLRFADEMGVRLAWSLMQDDPNKGPEWQNKLREGMREGLPLGFQKNADGEEEMMILPVAGMMAQAQIISKRPDSRLVPQHAGISEALGMLGEHPGVQMVGAALAQAGMPRITPSLGVPRVGLNLPYVGAEDVASLPLEIKDELFWSDMLGTAGFPMLYYTKKAIDAARGIPNPYTGRAQSAGEVLLQALGPAKATTVNMDKIEMGEAGRRKAAIDANLGVMRGASKLQLPPDEAKMLDDLLRQRIGEIQDTAK